MNRGLCDEHSLSRIFFTDNWASWASEFINPKYEKDEHDHRIVLPFYDLDGNIIGAQGRSLSGNKQKRYLTAKREDVAHMVFGLDFWNKYETTYVLEGPIDSLFIPNSIAVATSDLLSVFNRVPLLDKDKTIFIFDNEPFSKEIGKLMSKVIEKNYCICLWPNNIKEKDINEMILSGLTIENILCIINSNTKRGIAAELDFVYWKKY